MNVPYEAPAPRVQVAEQTRKRKDHHLDLCLDADVQGRRATGLADLRFEHNALPELELAAVDTRSSLFGRELKAPFVIGAMTGGSERAGRINAVLADAARECGVGMALGSQRAALENPALLPTYVGGARPPLRIGNVGAVQLNYGVTSDAICRLVDASDLDALALHLNPLQEAIQPEGDTNFRGLRKRIEELVPRLGVPLLLKEVGSGLSQEVAQWAASVGVAGLETAGVGGTSWAAVEGFRGGDRARRLGEVFRSFGLPTVDSLRACRRGAPGLPLLASGGLRTGLDGAKAIALGASAFAMARPLLEAASQTPPESGHGAAVETVVDALRCVIDELRITMFCAGCPDLNSLQGRPLYAAGAVEPTRTLPAFLDEST
jgi:isopentenyl-diphosphate delta-isomerase